MKLERPDWHIVHMAKAYEIALRSIDPRTKHGCVITKDNVVMGEGYNGPPPGCIDQYIPLEAPFKYKYFTHSEVNAIHNSRSMKDLEGSTFYITGKPCSSCFRSIRAVKASRIIYGPLKSVMIESDIKEEERAITILNANGSLDNQHIELITFSSLFYDTSDKQALQLLIDHKNLSIDRIKKLQDSL